MTANSEAQKRKLIEVALPLEVINRESAREKSIRHGHPSTLHLWWARRPLAAARAVLFAQLVDDPSSHPDEFPTEELQRKERDRLHKIIERLVVWENARDERLLEEAHSEILKSTNGSPPKILDPFAGGGTIPLEAQRLGLESKASDLNPVAVLINKALIELPPKFRDKPPVYPGLASSQIREWVGSEGLAADIRAYGTWMRDEAVKRIGNLYQRAAVPDGSKATVIAWIWARTVTCPNPGCGVEMPLVRSWWLEKKRNRKVFIVPSVVTDTTHPSGLRVEFDIDTNVAKAPKKVDEGSVGRTGATCLACEVGVPLTYIREQGRAKKLGNRLMAVVAEGNRQRLFLPPSRVEEEQILAVEAPIDPISGALGYYPRDLKAPTYGLTEFSDLFTPRQLVALTTFSDLAIEAHKKIAEESTAEYADAVVTYLGLGVSRAADRSSTIATWDSSASKIRNTFGRQAIPMTWDYAESSPFSESTGNYLSQIEWTAEAVDFTPRNVEPGVAQQQDAATASYGNVLVSTDPPYYDNIGYSDLSDYFYVWLRRTLRGVYPQLLSTMLVPKAEELVANPYRHQGADGAKAFFEDGFRQVFTRIRQEALDGYPTTVYYAFKQSEVDNSGTSSTGWETLLEGMIYSGWEITSTWPLRSELANRMMASGMNALASSIVLSLRPRPKDASSTDRRGFISNLAAELPVALKKLQQGQIAPVDLPQAAIGPGMAVFSRHSAVLEPDGTKMTVRSALARINEILDQVLNEQEGDFDSTSRFAIAWYRQHGYGTGKFGDADNLARARNTSVELMDRDGVLVSRAGVVQLLRPSELHWEYDIFTDQYTSNWEALHHLIKVLERDGISQAGEFLRTALSRPDNAVEADLIKELAHLLFRVAEGQSWTKDALSFNSLVTSWPEIFAIAQAIPPTDNSLQSTFDFTQEES